MSISYTVDIHCDRCTDWIQGITSAKPNTVRRSLAEAKREGWSRNTKSVYTDLCPSCLKHVRKEPK